MDYLVGVLDDEREIALLLEELLELHGFRVVTITHPALVKEVADMNPHLFLIDIMLPGVSGIEVAQGLRDQVSLSCPLVAMTASRLMAQVAESSGLFQAVIDKPFDIDVLIKTVESLVSTQRCS